MSSFRQYGGLDRAPTNNIVRNKYSNSDNPTISNYLGKLNTKIISASHIDCSGNSLMNVQGIYFNNGSTIINNNYNGNFEFSGNVNISNNLDVSGNVNISNNLDVSGNVNITNNLDVSGNVNISNNLDVSGNVNITNNLDVSGNSQFEGDVDISGNLSVSGTINKLYMEKASGTVFLTTNSLANMTGNNNTGFGNNIMVNATTAGTNSCFGYESGLNIETGDANTCIGSGSGIGIKDGIKNTALGYNSYANNDYSYSTAIGYLSQPTGDNQIMLGTSADTVVCPNNLTIATTLSTVGFINNLFVTFNGVNVFLNTIKLTNGSTTPAGYTFTGSTNTGVGQDVLYNAASASQNTCIGYQSGYSINTGSLNTALGYNSYVNNDYSNSTAIGYSSQPTGNNQIMLGTSLETVYCPNNLVVTGNTSSGSYTTTSDYRIKDIIESLDDHPEKYTIDNLKPLFYKNKKTNKNDIGFLAHEVEEHFPYLVNGIKDDPDKYQSLNYIGIIGLLVNEVKLCKERISLLERKYNENNDL